MKAYIKCKRMLYSNNDLMYHLVLKIGLLEFTLAISEAQVVDFIGRFYQSGWIEVPVFEVSGQLIVTPDDKTILTPEMIGLKNEL